MKTLRAIAASALVLSSFAATSAPAATGAFDGSYEIHYGLMNMGVQCGYADVYGEVVFDYENYLIDLSADEQLPADAFQPFLEARLAQIEAADLGYYQEQIATANAYRFFTGLRESLNLMIDTYPDAIAIDAIDGAVAPSPRTYAFNALMADSDFGHSFAAEGAMHQVNGLFGLEPAYVYGYRDGDAWLHTLWVGMQMGGSAAARVGALRWQAEKLNVDDYTGAVWGCGISNLAGFELVPAGAEPTKAPVAPTAFRLDAKAGKPMAAQVHKASAQGLMKQGKKLNAAQSQALSRTLAR